MDPADVLATVPTAAAAMADAGAAAGPSTPVPSCPRWDVERLLGHTGTVLRWVTAIVRAGGPVDFKSVEPPPAGAAAGPWLVQGASEVVAELTSTGPSAPCWTFAPGHATAGFWFRRLGHEVAVHGVDAALAAGRPAAIDGQLAADGIDELLTVLLPARIALGRADVAAMGTLHVHCTDVEGEWLVTPVAGGVEVVRAHAKGDAALRGPASDLLLRLHGRGEGGEVFGDAGVVDRLRAGFTL